MSTGRFMDIEDFDLGEGSRVGYQGLDGKLITGTITHFNRDKVTGEVTMSVEPDPDPDPT
ncbi:hypothetical protein [Mycobacterium intracellulare]|uniref:hypothetical protein n=1 Tax=Mycobacterium intracellulare TaxID=1767 RepID=UPI000CE4B551|nr:hypothetical protein [Mycobacterium intracellulare]